MQHIEPLKRLIERLRSLPGIGHKSATRLAYHVLEMDPKAVEELTFAIRDAKEKIGYCEICFNLTDASPCAICRASNRDQSVICVVEEPRDVGAMERTREFKGRYHVLHGVLSPLDGVGPDQLRIRELVARIGVGDIREVIVATNPDAEGEVTAMYIAKLLKPIGIKVTRIAHGIPMGSDLEQADEDTLCKALENRREL